jgi:DNA-binding protein WhiA
LSFSLKVKSELCRLQETGISHKKHELMGILRTGLTVRNRNQKNKVLFVTENASLSRHIFSRVKEFFNDNPGVIMLKTRRFRNHILYHLEFTQLLKDDRGGFLKNIGIAISPDNRKLIYEPVSIKDRNDKRAYLRGCFLATGSISDPDRSYHLEITLPNNIIADECINYLNEFGIKPRKILRKGHTLIYLKEGEEIVDFLNVVGAHSALMQLENIRILKGMRNQVNRIVNCETANLEKTVEASYRHVENINLIKESRGLKSLPKSLYEIAQLRLEHLDLSLSELGKLLNPPLSKSGVNHRLRRIDKIAQEIKMQ